MAIGSRLVHGCGSMCTGEVQIGPVGLQELKGRQEPEGGCYMNRTSVCGGEE